jgi:hypothetical protein
LTKKQDESQPKAISGTTSSSLSNSESQTSKQALLANALGSLRKKASAAAAQTAQAKSKFSENSQSKGSDEAEKESKDFRAPATSASHFPKYLANAFAQESKRIPETQDDPQLENVTNMIRAKLKEMKPLS